MNKPVALQCWTSRQNLWSFQVNGKSVSVKIKTQTENASNFKLFLIVTSQDLFTNSGGMTTEYFSFKTWLFQLFFGKTVISKKYLYVLFGYHFFGYLQCKAPLEILTSRVRFVSASRTLPILHQEISAKDFFWCCTTYFYKWITST